MALIGTLRDRMGTWVVVFVFVAITAFIVGDLFSGNSSILNWGQKSVGEIAGRDISIEEFQATIQERESNYALQFGRQAGEREMPTLRQQAWDLLIARHAVQAQYAKVGVQVSDDEVWDMIQGKNVDEGVRQAFTNPETGQFDANSVVSYLGQLRNMPAGSEPRVRWEIFQRDLKPSRERIKYENLLMKTIYVTKAEAERDYHLQTDVGEVKFLYVPYYAISDSAATVTDAALRDYYNKHIERYKTEETRDLKFVSFPVEASREDSLAVKEDMDRVLTDFRTIDDDSAYASSHTDGAAPYDRYNRGNLPSYISIDSLQKGRVLGPYLNESTYAVVKVSNVVNDTVSTARAKHILIKWTDDSAEGKRVAKAKAEEILRDIRAGADFGAKAREFGTDGTASRGGDLGWFSSGQMVKPFQDAVFGATRSGLLPNVVETDFGYHIISVTDVKSSVAYDLAIVERQIDASDATINDAYRKAESFANGLSNLSDFEARAKEQGYLVQEARNVTAGDRRIGTLGDARQVVIWLFRDASNGDVSTVFNLDDQNAVAIMTGKVSKGNKPVELVKDEITPIVRNEVKSKLIIDKLSATKGTLEEIAAAFGNDANIYSSSDLRLSSNSLPTVGFDPTAVGAAFALKSGEQSVPIAGDNGVVIVQMQNATIAPALGDYSAYNAQLQQATVNRTARGISEAIKENADIVDKRYKFY